MRSLLLVLGIALWPAADGAEAPSGVSAGADTARVALGPGASPIVVALASKKEKRFAVEGRLLRYDPEREVVVAEVVHEKVSGGFGTGRVAGDKPPASFGIERGQEVTFRVVPEGSVLRRTVFKSVKGMSLDNSGTKQGFARAFESVPKDRPVVLSFEKSGESGAGAPAFTLKMVQIRLTLEEIERRLEEISVEE